MLACLRPTNTLLTRLVNILSIVYASVYFPTYSNSLKEIGHYLGCSWSSAQASGPQSIVWRRQWEATQSATFKQQLTTYNMEDCLALRKVTEFLHVLCHHRLMAHTLSLPARLDIRSPTSKRSILRRAAQNGAEPISSFPTLPSSITVPISTTRK